MTIQLKRAYTISESDDGFRVLVNRLWPRGLSKQSAGIDLWLKEIAPSTELRKVFGHDPLKWEQFRERYFQELDHNPPAVGQLRDLMRHAVVTLVYGARDERYNGAVALKAYLESVRCQ